jgi:hypothetical protein
MKPRPFYRWKSFWVGIFVWTFFKWASALSKSQFMGIHASSTQTTYRLSRLEQNTYFIVGPALVLQQSVAGLGTHYLRGTKGGWESIWNSQRGQGVRYWRLPDSVAILLYSCLFSAWLLRHWKREQKKLA